MRHLVSLKSTDALLECEHDLLPVPHFPPLAHYRTRPRGGKRVRVVQRVGPDLTGKLELEPRVILNEERNEGFSNYFPVDSDVASYNGFKSVYRGER